MKARVKAAFEFLTANEGIETRVKGEVYICFRLRQAK